MSEQKDIVYRKAGERKARIASMGTNAEGLPVWRVYTGRMGDDLREYRLPANMDKRMALIGYYRKTEEE